ncbi:hypothetical protein FKX85_08280 [Echinicola soli]|nr:hypothetical protein [Echinicola soli]QDH79034.1 hypothetical protein FKX85_08280 [Echinicola soli]
MKWLRWAAAGVFGAMLVLNIMVGLDFEKDKVLPSVTLVELGNQAFARGESDDDGYWFTDEEQKDIYNSQGSVGGIFRYVGVGADWEYGIVGTHYYCDGWGLYCDYDEPYTERY